MSELFDKSDIDAQSVNNSFLDSISDIAYDLCIKIFPLFPIIFFFSVIFLVLYFRGE